MKGPSISYFYEGNKMRKFVMLRANRIENEKVSRLSRFRCF